MDDCSSLNQIKLISNNSKVSTELDIELLILNLLSIDKNILYRDDPRLSSDKLTELKELVQRRERGEPLAYLIKSIGFWSLDLYVDENVLVPRPETEILVDHINNLNLSPGVKILDAGVGSGCIGASLAKLNPETLIYGVDYSLAALQVAKINKQKFNLSNFYLINSIWLNSLKENMFDIIVSNPPYVAPFDPHLEELKHEPISALVAEQNGLRDFDLISSQAIKVLKKDGLLAFEHGNSQANEVRNIMINYGFKNIVLINDYQSQPRITLGKK